jgi:hypothetical protein
MMINEAAPVLAQTTNTFESEEYGFRLQIPQGWVIEEAENPVPNFTVPGSSEGLAILCLENEALPGIGGKYNCQNAATTDIIGISRWTDLQSRPEFESLEMVTTNDLLALRIQEGGNETSDLRIENNTDIDEFRKIVDEAYTHHDNAGTFLPFDDFTVETKSKSLSVLSQDRDTGYVINNNIVNDNQTEHSPALEEVFNSFQLVE